MALKRKTCKQCKTKYTPTRSDQLFCKPACRVSASRISTDKEQDLFSSLSKTGFLGYVVRECRRAGTIEILRGHTADTFIELHSVYTYNNKANAYAKVRKYEIGHIHPVNGVAGKIGCLHPANLVVQSAVFNRKHSTKYLGHGKSITTRSLKAQWRVSADTSNPDLFALIFSYLGYNLLRRFKRVAQPRKMARVEVLEWFEKFKGKACLLDRMIDLDSMDVPKLRALRDSLLYRPAFNLSFDPFDNTKVVQDELERLSTYRPDLLELRDWLKSASTSYQQLQKILSHITPYMDSILAGGGFTLSELVAPFEEERQRQAEHEAELFRRWTREWEADTGNPAWMYTPDVHASYYHPF